MLAIDCLSIIASHIVVEDDGSFLRKFLSIDIFNIIMGFLSKESLRIREYSIKLLQLLLSSS